MLSSLRIRNYVLIDSSEIDFPEGLVIISGPTGAGKSILIGALGLLMGAKADAGVIAAGADSCVVEGEFDVNWSAGSPLASFCEENDIECGDGHFVIRRVVNASGRSRSFVNDCPVQAPVLGQLSRFLVDVHSQHDTLMLTDRRYQLSILDAFAGNAALLRSCSDAYSALRAMDADISELEGKIAAARREEDYNASMLERLDKAGLQEGEIASLEEEQYKLSHSGHIKELLEEAEMLFSGDGRQQSGVCSQLNALARTLDSLKEYMPEFTSLAERIGSARIEVKDIADEVAGANSSLDCSPERLQWVDDRLGQLYSLLKRYECEDEAALVAKRDSLRTLVCGMDDLESDLDSLRRRRKKMKEEFDGICRQLSASRTAAAASFSARIMENLSFMELDRAVFEVLVSPAQEAGQSGADDVAFMFSATGGRTAPVAKCASGGELSRIMLSLKQLMSGCMDMPTMIFDEIDTGVSGSVADRMGSVICSMGRKMQVFAITHLPQVAAKGSAHYLVEKSVDSGRATSTIKKLSDRQRVLEVARMLSGSTLTPEAIANAESLLG